MNSTTEGEYCLYTKASLRQETVRKEQFRLVVKIPKPQKKHQCQAQSNFQNTLQLYGVSAAASASAAAVAPPAVLPLRLLLLLLELLLHLLLLRPKENLFST